MTFARSTGITKIKLHHTYDFRLLTRIKFVPYLWLSPFFTMSTHASFLFSMDSSFDNSTTGSTRIHCGKYLRISEPVTDEEDEL